MALTTYNAFIERIANGYWRGQTFGGERPATTQNLLTNNGNGWQRVGDTQLMPGSLPTGVTSFIPTRVSFNSSQGSHSILIAELTSLGSINIATPTFTDGSVMPTITELGVSRKLASPVLCEVTTALNATPGSLQITYKDQDDNAAEANSAQALTASSTVGSSSWVTLNTGDTGVVDITAATRTGGTTPTGVIKFWGVRPIALIPASLTTGGTVTVEDLIASACNLIRLGAAAQVGCFAYGNLAAKVIYGEMYLVGDS